MRPRRWFDRFDSWASRNRPRLAVAFVALILVGLVLGGVASATDVTAIAVLARVALLLAFPTFLALAVAIRHASGGGGGGGVSGFGGD